MLTVRIFFFTKLLSLSIVHLSYIWRHLDIGYVQGMCDLLAPLLVILDDGESAPPSPASLVFGVFLRLLRGRPLPTLLLTLSFRLHLLLFRGHGFQLLQPAHEENESKLPTRRSHGHSLCQHALSNPGGAAPVMSAHSQAALNIIYYHNLSHYFCF